MRLDRSRVLSVHDKLRATEVFVAIDKQSDCFWWFTPFVVRKANMPGVIGHIWYLVSHGV